MKRWAFWCFVAAVLALLLLPLCGADYAAIGRETAGQQPLLTKAAESFDRHVGFRQESVDAYNRVSVALLRDTGTESVLLGDEMLFFTRTLSDYQQSAPMTDEEVERAADALLAFAEKLRRRGVAFVFLGAPNKNEIYPEKMPACYRRGEGTSDLERLQQALAERSVAYIDAVMLLRAADEPVYHRTDTHWNDSGALRVYRALMDTLGLSAERYESADWADAERVGDLEQMAFPMSAQAEHVRALRLEKQYRTERPMRSLNDMKIVTHVAAGQGRLVVSRDSFGEALFPLLANQCETLVYTRSRDVDELLALAASADAVVVELVQRNLRLLIGQNAEAE